jgi:hypothetical protein
MNAAIANPHPVPGEASWVVGSRCGDEVDARYPAGNRPLAVM